MACVAVANSNTDNSIFRPIPVILFDIMTGVKIEISLRDILDARTITYIHWLLPGIWYKRAE